MNSKMIEMGRKICEAIELTYDNNYLSELFSGMISINDVILQVLYEYCRCAYLSSAEVHPLTYYISGDEFAVDAKRKEAIRQIEYARKLNATYAESAKKKFNIDVQYPNKRSKRKTANRFAEYSLSEFDYWEITNIHDMQLVKKILERQIGSSKKISNKKFATIFDEYSEEIQNLINLREQSTEDYAWRSIALYTIEQKYQVEYFYRIVDMLGEKEPLLDSRMVKILALPCCGNYYGSILPIKSPELAPPMAQRLEYPMILARQRLLMIYDLNDDELIWEIHRLREASVLVNSVRNTMVYENTILQQWFLDNTNIDDWVSVFKTYDLSSIYQEKEWTGKKIKQMRNLFNILTIDYKNPEIRP